MEDIASFVQSLGGLHDCLVLRLDWFQGRQRVEMEVSDIYWNDEGLPEYRGPQRAVFAFSVVETVEGVFPVAKQPVISEWQLAKGDEGFSSRIRFRSGEDVKFRCQAIMCEPCQADTISSSL